MALCLGVGVVGIGDTETEALHDLDEAAVMLISYLREEGREYELADRKVDPDRLRDFLWEEAEEEEIEGDRYAYFYPVNDYDYSYF